MHIFFKCKIFSRRQRHTGRRNTLYCRVGSKVYKEHRAVDCARALEIRNEEVRLFKRDTDSRKHNGKVCIGAADLRLTCYLSRKVCMRHTGAGENRQFLSADKRIQPVDCGNSRLNKFGGIVSRGGIYRRAVYIKRFFGDYFGTAVNNLAHTGENTSEHIGRNAELNSVAEKTHLALRKVKSRRAFKKLNEDIIAVYFKHTAAADGTVRQFYFAKLIIFDAFNSADKHKRSGDFFYRLVFSYHYLSSLSVRAASSAVISLSISSYSATYFSGSALFALPIFSLTGRSAIFSISAPRLSASPDFL